MTVAVSSRGMVTVSLREVPLELRRRTASMLVRHAAPLEALEIRMAAECPSKRRWLVPAEELDRVLSTGVRSEKAGPG